MIKFHSKLLLASAATLCSMAFDPDAFMGQTFDGELSTEIVIPPEGDYRAYFDTFDAETGFRTFEAKKGNNAGKEYTIFTPTFAFEDDPRLLPTLQARGVDKFRCAHKGIFLDFSDEGKLDFSNGKNVDLGRMREAVGQNQMAGWGFKNLIGAGPVMVHLMHEKDQNDDTKKYARVNRVVKIS